MKIIWSQAEPAYQGDFVNFSKMKAYPKPVQSPYPAIIGGGGKGPKTLEFVVNHCSGWMPILGHPDWSGIKEGIDNLHQLASQAGREASSFELSIFCWSPPEQKIREEMQSYGVKKLVISFEGRSREEALPLLDEYAQLIN